MAPSGIEPATFWFVAEHLNHCANAVPRVPTGGCGKKFCPAARLKKGGIIPYPANVENMVSS